MKLRYLLDEHVNRLSNANYVVWMLASMCSWSETVKHHRLGQI